MKSTVWPAFLFAATLAIAACGGGGAPEGTPSPALPPTSTATPSPTDTPAPTATTVAPAPTPAPPTSTPPAVATVIRRGETTTRAVALTFDAGSDAGYTSQILDTLAHNDITAAFGITGRWAEENPDLLRRIVRDGHDLINHSYDHSSFTGLSTGAAPLTQAERWAQLDRTEGAVQHIAGATTTTLPYFRPPFGDYDESVNRDVAARGYAYNVMWTVDSFGWRGIDAAAIVERCLSLAEPGAVYIFHVGSASQDGPALQRIIDGLRADGYTFVPLTTFAP